MFADFKKAFKKPEFTMSLTEEQMKVFMGEEPDVKCHLVEIKKRTRQSNRVPIFCN
ncbi:hypothetical protein ACT7DL_23730 [Bacillus paranthracis]